MFVAVVVDSVVKAANATDARLQELRRRDADSERRLKEIFQACDRDGSGVLTLEEFHVMMRDPVVQRQIAQLYATFQNPAPPPQDLE